MIRESAVIQDLVIDVDSSDEDPCTDDISLLLRLQISENSKLKKELKEYLCKICLVKNVNIIIKPCHHFTCDTCMEKFINLYLKNVPVLQHFYATCWEDLFPVKIFVLLMSYCTI